jgi:SMI1-KNR4 cell-wall
VWQETVSALAPNAKFSRPAPADELEAIGRALSITLPRELRELLAETNGISDRYGGGLVWPAYRIVSDNLMFRSSFDGLYMSFDSLLFFADAGNGDQFAFAIKRGQEGELDPDVYVWDHEDDSRRWYAGSLLKYLESWLGGEHPL